VSVVHTEVTDPNTMIASPDILTLLIKEDWYSVEHIKELNRTVHKYMYNHPGIDMIAAVAVAEEKIIEQGATLLPHEQFIIPV